SVKDAPYRRKPIPNAVQHGGYLELVTDVHGRRLDDRTSRLQIADDAYAAADRRVLFDVGPEVPGRQPRAAGQHDATCALRHQPAGNRRSDPSERPGQQIRTVGTPDRRVAGSIWQVQVRQTGHMALAIGIRDLI